MRRTLYFLVAALAGPGLLAACGDDDTDRSSTDGGGGGGEHDEHDGASPVADGARQIEVTGRSFEFDPVELEAGVGEDIAIVLTSDDELLHDLTIDELDVHVAAGAGETAEGSLRADEAGTYSFYCSVEGHREAGMEGTLVVG